MNKVTEYDDKRSAVVKIATDKARIHGKSTWAFSYRGQLVQVKAEKVGGKIKIHTDNVKNK